MNKQIFSLDKLEGDMAVCISDDDDVVVVPMADLGGLCVRDVFSAKITGDKLTDITPMPEERDRRIRDSRLMLHALARKTKNKS